MAGYEEVTMTQERVAPAITIRSLRSGDDGSAFRTLNEEWISKLFVMEPHDFELLDDPEGEVLAKGGHIFFVDQDGEAVGCVALIAMGDGLYEVSKMAVSPALRGMGVGRRLLEHAVAAAREFGARALYLASSKKLQNAVHLYEAVGFQHVPRESLPPTPYTRGDVFMKMEF
jgi:putative acetyltransferase